MKKTLMTFASESIVPQEKLYIKEEKNSFLTIGIPKENGEFERRVPLTPESVKILTSMGHKIFIEKGVGEYVFYSDLAYSEAGALVCEDIAEIWQCDIVIKIAPPSANEVKMMKNKSTFLSFLQLSMFSKEALEKITEKRINAVSLELISDSQNKHSIINSILEIEGKTAIVLAAELLTNTNGGKGILLGGCPGVTPTEIVIIGAGRAGREAARTADALGALVKVFDNNIDLLREIQTFVSPSTFTSTLHPNVLINAFKSADIVIGTLRFENGEKKFIVSEDMIANMKKGALIIDLSIDQGGCFETSVCPDSMKETLYEQCGVIHYCIPNISSRVARTTSIALSNHCLPLLIKIADSGNINDHMRKERNFRNGVYIYNGKIVNKFVGEHFNLPWSDIMLFLAPFQ
ncbi:MAG: alanine dehydrogenase [Bacteroidales bacterium]|nr:alanine dehydrogenase [Bacteroidales bacterium]